MAHAQQRTASYKFLAPFGDYRHHEPLRFFSHLELQTRDRVTKILN
jgi:hypothetical protein